MAPNPKPTLAATLLINKILAAALISGVGIFLLVAGFIVGKPMARAGSSPLGLLSIGLLVLMLIVPPVAARLVSAQAMKQIPPGDFAAQDPVDLGRRLLQVYQVQMLVQLAPLEGASLFGAVVFLVMQSPVGLAVALAGMVAMAMRFPTRSRVESWLAAAVQKARG